MTHTLHPEIEEAIEKMIKDMELPAEVGAKLFIIQSLGKYLHMPQPIENEPLPEKNDCYRCGIPCSDIYCGKCGQSQEIVMEGPKQSTPQIEKIDQQFAEKIVDWLINKYNLRYEPF